MAVGGECVLDGLHARGFKEVILSGVHLGGYGWVENLEPASARRSEGYIHAPSLQQATTARLPGFHGGIGQAGQLAATSPHAAAALAQAFAISFAVALAICVIALIPTALIPHREA